VTIGGTAAILISGRKQPDDLLWVGKDRLIPLKADAWLDFNARQAKGNAVDARNIRKHANYMIRLSQLFAPEVRIPLAATTTVSLWRSCSARLPSRMPLQHAAPDTRPRKVAAAQTVP